MTWRAALWSSDDVFWFLLWFSSLGRGPMAVRVAYLADFDKDGAAPRGAVVLAGSIQSGPLQPADTRIRSPIRTFMVIALREFAYELSLFIAVRVILPAKRDLFAIEGQQAVIANGDAMGVPTEIAKHAAGRPKRWFRVYDPVCRL
jgi:hypothetical protein